MQSFEDLNLIPPLLKALQEKEYIHPSPIQQQAIPAILSKKDILGCAQTGTGKTAAFSLPIIQLLVNQPNAEKRKNVRALILTPTRELASQVGENIKAYVKYTNIKHTVIYGGVSQHTQVEQLKKGVDIIIATPGRLKDLINQGFIDLSSLHYFVLDEADKMLDMGFIKDIKFILSKIPAEKQSVFFTATLSEEIIKLADSILTNPLKIEIKPVHTKEAKIDQSIYFVEKKNKKSLLLHLLDSKSIQDVLVFTRTKHGADRLSNDLNKLGIKADSMHGGKTQSARQRALSDFKSKRKKVLVVTDVASRGIDIEKLSYVINFDIPNTPETYVHRIGRTGRAGESGTAISFCDNDELKDFKLINKLTLNVIQEIKEHPYPITNASVNLLALSTSGDKTKSKNTSWRRDRKISGNRNSSSRNSR